MICRSSLSGGRLVPITPALAGRNFLSDRQGNSRAARICGVPLTCPPINQTQRELRVVCYRVGNVAYWVATARHDLSAGDIAMIYKLRWQIEIFFGWWKRHLKVYHLIARSRYASMVQILGGLVTYLLLAIYRREQHQEKVSLHWVRELRSKIQNEARNLDNHFPIHHNLNEHHPSPLYAKT
jgi:hypothetical protein